MQNISYDYAKSVMRQREAGLRRAQLSGEAFEYKPRRRFRWTWRREETPVPTNHPKALPDAH